MRRKTKFILWSVVALALFAAGLAPVAASGDAAAPSTTTDGLPPGARTLTLPKGAMTFRLVERGNEQLVELRTKDRTIQVNRLFVRHRDNVILFQATKKGILLVIPSGPHSYTDNFTWVKGTMGVGDGVKGGLWRIQRGDLVVTHPDFIIEVESRK